jgi:hypothetical protein
MNTVLEPALRAEEDDVLRALATIIETTRRHWQLPDRRPADAAIGIGPESFRPWPYPRASKGERRPRPSG